MKEEIEKTNALVNTLDKARPKYSAKLKSSRRKPSATGGKKEGAMKLCLIKIYWICFFFSSTSDRSLGVSLLFSRAA